MKKLLLALLLQQAIFADTLERSGDALLLLLPSLAVGSTLYHDDKEGQIQFAKSFVTNATITYGLKFAIDKRRPNGEDENSFPSGHTSATFQSAAFIHQRYGLKYGLPAYIAAAYTGYTRVESDKHYTIDVLAGAAIGTLSSFYFTTYKGMTIKPMVMQSKYGFSITKEW